MGMFDEISCYYPLPGTLPSYVRRGHKFQTKDFDCTCTTYTLSEDGTIDVPGFTGNVEFYTSNICGSWGVCTYTPDGEDAESVTYEAKFIDGKLADVTQVSLEVGPALPAARMRTHTAPRPTEEDVNRWERERCESLVGRTLFRQWGSIDGKEPGYHVEIVAEGPTEWVGRKADGTFEVIDRRERNGNTLFDNEEDAKANTASRNETWERAKAEFEVYAREWTARRSSAAGAR